MDIQPKPSSIDGLSDWLTWLVMIGVSLLGGLASFVRKMKAQHVRVWNLTELIGELTISAFAGIVAFNLCQSYGRDVNLTVAIVGVVSHMGTKGIMLIEKWLSAKFPAPEKD